MARNNDTGKLPEKQPHHRKPETRGRLVGAEPVKCNDGTIMKAYIVDESEIKDTDFLKENKLDREAKNTMINNTDSIVLWWTAVQGMAYNNSTEISVVEICKAFGWGRRRVEEARNYLKEKGLIKKISGNIYILNPYYASRISPVYRPALENAWRKGTVRYFDDDRTEIDAQRKERKAALNKEQPTVEPDAEPVRERYNGGEQMLITDVTNLTPSLEECRKDAILLEVVRQKNRERQRLCRERKRQAAREAAEAAKFPLQRTIEEYAPWEVIPEELYAKRREEEEIDDVSFI